MGCIVSSFLSLVPWSWRIAGISVLLLLLAAAAGIGAFAGYGEGYAKANALGAAALAAEKEDRQKEDTARALAVAQAEKTAREKLQQAVAKADELETRLITAQTTLATERASINKRIADAAKNTAATCAGLSADWVRTYNDALLGPGGQPGDQEAHPTLAQGAAKQSAGAVPRLSPGKSLTSPADILAHARDYGQWCRRNTSQLNGWIDLSEGWE